MERAYKFRIYPTSCQIEQIQKTFGCARFVYNYYLNKRIEAYEVEHIKMNYFACCADLTKIKQKFLWLKEVDTTALQSSLKDLDNAFVNFFKSVKKGGTTGFPCFKRKRCDKQSYTCRSSSRSIHVFDDGVQLPIVGRIKARISCQITGRILSATVSNTLSGKYFVSFCCTDFDITTKPSTGAVIGIDLGLKTFVTTSDGQKFENHRYLAKSQKKLARLQRQLSRKSKGSSNREKARLRLAKAYEKVTNQRNDTLHKLSLRLVTENDVICVEHLRIANMIKNRKLSNAIGDASWGIFLQYLRYKAVWYGRDIVQVAPFFASSQICNICGYKCASVKRLSVREWTCPECGTRHDRDVNAANNILAEGMRILAES